MIGLGLGLNMTRNLSAFNPSTLALTGFWRGSYSASPWVGTASAGSSGSRNISNSGATAPSPGPALNGYAPASFNGTSNFLADTTDMTSLVSTSAYFIWALVYVGSIATGDQVHPYNNDSIFMDGNGVFGISISNNKVIGGGNCVQFYHFDGSPQITEIAISTGAYALVQLRYDGASVHCKVNSGSVQTMTAGNLASLSTVLDVGCNYNGSHFMSGRVMELGFMNSAQSDARFDDIKSYDNARYALNL